jgi:dTDP-4-dehydrorhamnose reductase
VTRVVIIGKTGQLAMELQRAMVPEGWTVTALGRDQLDLLKPQRIIGVVEREEPDVLINAAAYTAVDQAEIEQELAFQVNGIAPGILAQAAARLSIPFLQVSTDYVFDGRAGPQWNEDDEPAPLNVYGRSKLAGEKAALNSGAKVVILRTAWVFSAHGKNFLKTMLRMGSERRQIAVVSDQVGEPTGASDIASALIAMAAQLIQHPESNRFGIYHFAGLPVTNWAGFAEAIFERAQWLKPRPLVKPISSAEYLTPARRPANSVLACAKIRHHFGIGQPDWRPALSRAIKLLEPESLGAGL